MKSFLIVVLAIIASMALSWAVIVGLVRLIFLCFGWPFNIPLATGIWLIFCLWKLLVGKREKEG